MPLQSGERLGPYEILSLLGAGGMGEVYLAHDPRLQRKVAVKVLSAETANDPAIRQRFEVEARAASHISHPNIVAVYDFGNQDGLLYIVWELVDGKPLLAEPLPLRKALDIAAQVADGIAAAHSAGIVHRDLKPDNILVTADGRAKVLDFGLAKRTGGLGASGDNNATQTRPGMMMGTIGYMSPEQVKGQEVDHRTDIFSFGLVLYEMLASKKAFGGETAIAALHAIVSSDPPELGDHIPMSVKQIVNHCIEKQPEARFQSTRDLSFALRAVAGASTRDGIAVSSMFEVPKRKWYRNSMTWVAALLGISAVGAFFAGKMSTPKAPDLRFHQLTFQRGFVSGARFTPDGHTVAYSAAWAGEPMGVYTARIETPDSQKTGISKAHVFSISKGGEMAIGLDADFGSNYQVGTLARVQLVGGAPRELLKNVTEADWDSKGENLAVVVTSGNSRRLEYPPGKKLYETVGWIRSLRFSPQGDKLAFLEHPVSSESRGSVVMIDLTGKKSVLVPTRHAVDGLVWAKGGQEVWFGSASTGEANQVEAVNLESGATRLVISTPANIRLQDIDADGNLLMTKRDDHVEMIGVKAGAESRPMNLSWLNNSVPRQITDDGKVLFTEFGQGAGPNYAVGLRSFDGSPVVRLGDGNAMALAADGSKALATLSGNPPQFVYYPTGAGESKKVPTSGIVLPMWAQFHPDGQRIVFEGGTGQADRLWVQALGGGQSNAISQEGVSMTGQSLSPDGQYVCATSPEGKLALYPVEGGAMRPLLGTQPKDRLIRWSADGKMVYVHHPYDLPIHIESIETATGKRAILTEYVPMDSTGIFQVEAVLSTDTKMAVYGLHRFLSNVQMVHGLR